MSNRRDDEPGLAELEILKDPQATERERLQAFERLLSLESGWWGRGNLMSFALGYALAATRTFAAQRHVPVDALDWESVAHDSLLILATGATRSVVQPREWLKGVIHNRLRNELRRSAPTIFGAELSNDLAVTEEQSESARATEAALLSQYDQLISAIQDLPPALRIVSQMWLLQHQSASEIATSLGLTLPTVRQRMSRARSALIHRLSGEVREPKARDLARNRQVDTASASVLPELVDYSETRRRPVEAFLSELLEVLEPEDIKLVHDYLLAVLRVQVAEIMGVLMLFLTELEDYLQTRLPAFERHTNLTVQEVLNLQQPRPHDRPLTLLGLLHFYSKACVHARLVEPSIRFGNWGELVVLRNNLVHARIDLASEWKEPLQKVLRHTDPLRSLTAAVGRATETVPHLTYLVS